MALAVSRLDRLRRPWSKGLFAAACLLFSIGRLSQEQPALKAAHLQNVKDVEWISRQGNAVVLGDYFNTFRFAPFVSEKTVITTAPDAEEAVKIFELSSHESRIVERWSKELGFSAYAEDLPSGRYRLYSRFSPEPSAYVLSILSSYLRERYLPDIERFGPWHQVLENDAGRIRFPRGARFRIPEGLVPPCGRYVDSLVFFDMIVKERGSMELEGKPCAGSIVSSVLTDPLTFRWEEDLVTGLPVEGLRLELRDGAIDSVDLHLYSFFDFESSIWANRYEQALILNGRAFPVRAGHSVVRYPRSEGEHLQIDSRHKTLLPAHDSRENVVFHNTGIVLERLVVHRRGIAEDVDLFLKPASEENARSSLGLPE
jgi:hypothetical protein